MVRLKEHLRNKFLAGIFAAIPLVLTALIIWYVEARTRTIVASISSKIDYPFIGVVLAIAGIYLLGLAVSNMAGRMMLGWFDRLMLRIPVLRELYEGWKHVMVTPGGTEGTFSKVTLISDESGRFKLLGFTSGKPIEGDPQTICVFVPNSPVPSSGRLYFVHLSNCQFLDISTEEAFKIILSTGNYVPRQIGEATSAGVVSA